MPLLLRPKRPSGSLPWFATLQPPCWWRSCSLALAALWPGVPAALRSLVPMAGLSIKAAACMANLPRIDQQVRLLLLVLKVRCLGLALTKCALTHRLGRGCHGRCGPRLQGKLRVSMGHSRHRSWVGIVQVLDSLAAHNQGCRSLTCIIIRRKCKEVRCKPRDFADGYGAWLQRSNVCFDASASVVVQIVDTCACHYPGNTYSNKRWW